MLDALTAGQKSAPVVATSPSAALAKLLVIDVSDTAADLAWTPVVGAKTYRIARAGADGVFLPVGEVSGPSFADNGLQPSTSYRWRVTAVINETEGPASPIAEATTLSKPEHCASPGQCPIGEPKK